jgi:uncharacterized protein YbgA (DUF1722 family)
MGRLFGGTDSSISTGCKQHLYAVILRHRLYKVPTKPCHADDLVHVFGHFAKKQKKDEDFLPP